MVWQGQFLHFQPYIKGDHTHIYIFFPQGTTNNTLQKSPPKTTTFPSNGCLLFIFSCKLLYNVSMAQCFTIGATSHIITCAFCSKSTFHFVLVWCKCLSFCSDCYFEVWVSGLSTRHYCCCYSRRCCCKGYHIPWSKMGK